MPWEEAEEEIPTHSESRTIAITLSSANYRFDIVTPLDNKGVERSRFAEGEAVRCRIKVTNKGDVKTNVTFKITDSDTGAVLEQETMAGVDPGKSIDANLPVGAMPNRNWNWLVAVTP